jgi:hypothetical protein
VTVPGGFAPQGVSASFGGGGSNFASSGDARTAFLTLFNLFFPGTVTFNSDGSTTMVVDFFFLPLTFVFNPSGVLTELLFGSIPLFL